MNFVKFVLLTLALGVSLLAFQRTLRKLRWITMLLIVVPVVSFSYTTALREQQIVEWRSAAIAALALNVLFWVLYGRSHPPGHKGDIIVLGMEDMEDTE